MTVRCDEIRYLPGREAVFAERVAILIPAYNEARHLPRLLAECRAVEPALVLVVDDCSTDDTARVMAAEVALRTSVPVHCLHNERNIGKQGAVRRGLRWLASKDIDAVALVDGDGQHDPLELPSLAGLLGSFDVVIGARSQAQMPVQRQLSNWLVNLGYRLIGGVDFVDVQSGLRLYRKTMADVLARGLSQRGGYGLEHGSLTILVRYVAARGDQLRVAAAPISCVYGGAESGIGLWSTLRLARETFRQAFRVRLATLPAAMAAAV